MMRLWALQVECVENFNVKILTSLKIGGNISRCYFPKSVDEFVEVVKNECEAKVFGNFSNTLVSSDGYDLSLIHISEPTRPY